MAEILFWESNTRCHHQLYSGLWTSRCLVLNILARRDLFSTERSNVQHQQDLRPRFLQLISVFVFDACRHIERRTEKVNQLCKKLLKQLSDPVKYDLSSLFRFFLFLAKFRSVYKEKKQVTHFILYIKKPHGEIDHKTIVITIITIIITFMIIMIIIMMMMMIIIIMIGYIFQSFVLLSVIRLILSCARFLFGIAYFVALNRMWS